MTLKERWHDQSIDDQKYEWPFFVEYHSKDQDVVLQKSRKLKLMDVIAYLFIVVI